MKRLRHGYLDAAATAPLRQKAREAMLEVLDAGFGNPSSVHSAGHAARERLEEARSTIARSLGATAEEVVFTSGGTEANNLAILGPALAEPRGRHVVTSAIEHPSVLESCRFLERTHDFEVTELAVGTDGRIDARSVADAVRDDTTLVSIGLANAEIGTVQPIAEIARAVRTRGVRMHTDAVQAAASLPLSFDTGREGAWPGGAVDAVTVASHKFGGPHGAGALLVRRHLALEPVLHGGGQERGARSGTENLLAIAGFAAAVEATTANVGTRALTLMQSRDALVQRVTTGMPRARLTGHAEERLPGHASFVFEGVSGESLLVALDAAGFQTSSGSACAAGRDDASPTLLAMGMSEELAQTALRFTLAEPLGSDEISRIVEVLASEVNR
ncbi:cysteine desulfurase family protein [uncultured Agrococcus sp.]|uniref:cysteine desulfurase family protein n=1 Tax=uncultured Agrococcus sp. TaxID=382258 RepID=UPI0025D55570|nr:cysteine desulfurase family protein [uncultured Agrococcus sp.]